MVKPLCHYLIIIIRSHQEPVELQFCGIDEQIILWCDFKSNTQIETFTPSWIIFIQMQLPFKLASSLSLSDADIHQEKAFVMITEQMS